jgi:hypothetical protein
MRTIHKYMLDRVEEQDIAIPEGARILSIMVRNGIICVWAEVDLDNVYRDWTFWVIGTGRPILEDCTNGGNHYASVMDGQAVWHIYTDD